MTDADWDYLLMLGAQLGDNKIDRATAAEIGFYSTAQDAANAGITLLGKTVSEVYNDSTLPDVTGMVDTPAWDNAIIIGFTVERYDGEETDGNWSINGGITAARKGK